MVHKRLLRTERLRAVPNRFSWVDHRLVRERLGWSGRQLRAARRGLIEADLIPYEAPWLYQVLSLDRPAGAAPMREDRGPCLYQEGK